MKIYTASKVSHASRWRGWRDSGYPIISTWIDEAGEGGSTDYSELADRCIVEAAEADVTILFCRDGEL